MLSKQYRGLSDSDIADLFKQKHFSRSNESFLLIWRNADRGFPKFSVIFPSKLKITSVKRNKIKRKIFNSLKTTPLSWTEGKNYAILVRSHALRIDTDELRTKLQKLFHRH